MTKDTFQYTDERFADLQLLRYKVTGFEHLSLKQKILIYHLSEAALWGRDILWDQNCRYNLRIRQLLEAIYTDYPGDRQTADFREFTVYLKRVWFSNGIHHHYGSQKLRPGFSREFFRQAVNAVPAGKLPFGEGQDSIESLIEELLPVLFDPQVMSKRVNQAEGEDLLLTSACNYYGPEITQEEAEDYYRRQKELGDKLRPVKPQQRAVVSKIRLGSPQRSAVIYGKPDAKGLALLYISIRRKTAPTIRTLEKLCAGFQLLPNDLLVKPALTQELVFRVPMVVTQCRGRHTVLGFATYPICPHCQITLEREYQAYCDRCGRRLRWKEYAGAGVVLSAHGRT